MSRGTFIVFEGIDGTGKTTQISLLTELLQVAGHQVVQTREPSDGQFGQKIRALFNSRKEITREEEISLFLEDRREHVRDCIEPALEQGQVVLCDRYFYSTAAYQGAAGEDPVQLFERNRFAPVPDLAIFLTIDPEESVRRIEQGRGDTLNDFEQLEQLKKVASLFASFNRPEIVRVSGTGCVDTVQSRISDAVHLHLPELFSN